MATAQELSRDPEFLSLDDVSKRQVLESVDPEFTSLDEESKAFVLSSLKAPTTGLSPEKRTALQQSQAQEAAARQAIIQEAQRGGLEKAISGALGLGKAVASPVVGIAKAIGSIPEVVADPSRIPATVGESARRAGIDIVQLGQMLSELGRPKSATEIMAGPVGAVGGALFRGIGNLRSYTPTEEQIAAELAKQPMQQAIGEERTKIAFEGAEPAVAEGITQAFELISPIKGAQALKAGGKGLAAVPRNIRAAIKPPKGVIGKRIENAAEQEFSEIFHRNPNADTAANTPIEGFAIEVEGAFKEAGDRIKELRARSGTVLNAGDQIADKIEAKASSLERAGNKDIADELRTIAAQKRGTMTDVNSLQDAVTLANRKSNILRPKTDAQGFADEIISKEGGSLINKELEAVGGVEGAEIRKKWSNLKVINDNLQERVNKIINSAPADAPPAFVNAISSVQGAAGLFGVLNGYASALPGLVAEGFRKWAQREANALKNSNTIIERTYREARKTPPARVTAEAPPIPQVPNQEILNLQIQRLLEESGVGREATPKP